MTKTKTKTNKRPPSRTTAETHPTNRANHDLIGEVEMILLRASARALGRKIKDMVDELIVAHVECAADEADGILPLTKAEKRRLVEIRKSGFKNRFLEGRYHTIGEDGSFATT